MFVAEVALVHEAEKLLGVEHVNAQNAKVTLEPTHVSGWTVQAAVEYLNDGGILKEHAAQKVTANVTAFC